MKIAFESLGCAKNLVDMENMLSMLTERGHELVDDESLADVIIVNTCCFINDAKIESIDTIIDLAQWKNDGECKRLIVTGCMAQRYKEQVLMEMPEVDAVLGVGEYDRLIEVVEGTDTVCFCDRQYSYLEKKRYMQTPSYTAYLKIADGCDNHCTYCVIPSIRGGFNSRPMEKIIAEAKELVKNGAKELIIIAQDTTSYGIDLYGEVKIAQLLTELDKIDGLVWIRLHYCYPEKITDELIDIMAKSEKICKYIDMPIQHCSDDVLKRMGRKSRKQGIIDVIEKLRAKIPGITIRTSLIAGFPGETEEQVKELAEFVSEYKFERLGVFAYSQEEDTPAAVMDNQIDDEEKLNRQEHIMLAQDEVNQEISESKVGTVQKVLVEGYDKLVEQYYGRSEADSVDIDGKIFFKSAKKLKEGEFTDVVINEYYDCDLFGERVGD